MKGYRFYLEHKTTKDKRNNINAGTVIAIYGETWLGSHKEACVGGVASVFDHANSVVCGSNIALHYLRTRCKSISEKKARLIHPNLFTYLDRP